MYLWRRVGTTGVLVRRLRLVRRRCLNSSPTLSHRWPLTRLLVLWRCRFARIPMTRFPLRTRVIRRRWRLIRLLVRKRTLIVIGRLGIFRRIFRSRRTKLVARPLLTKRAFVTGKPFLFTWQSTLRCRARRWTIKPFARATFILLVMVRLHRLVVIMITKGKLLVTVRGPRTRGITSQRKLIVLMVRLTTHPVARIRLRVHSNR